LNDGFSIRLTIVLDMISREVELEDTEFDLASLIDASLRIDLPVIVIMT
jgi:hypothetical protein